MSTPPTTKPAHGSSILICPGCGQKAVTSTSDTTGCCDYQRRLRLLLEGGHAVTINYRTVAVDGRPTVEGRTSKPVLVWEWFDGRYIGPYVCCYEPNRGVWNNGAWRCAKGVNPQDKWVWVEELEPGYAP